MGMAPLPSAQTQQQTGPSFVICMHGPNPALLSCPPTSRALRRSTRHSSSHALSSHALSSPALRLQVRAPLEKKLAEEPGFLQALSADIAKLAAELAALGVAENGSA